MKGGWKESVHGNEWKERGRGGREAREQREGKIIFILCNRKGLLDDVTYSLYQV